MESMLTGAKIIKNGEFFEIFYKNQLLTSVKSKELAVGIAINRENLEMLQKNNTNNNVFYLKVA